MYYDKIITKITSHNDIYIVFYKEQCTYSRNALSLLQNHQISYKGYNVENIRGGLSNLLHILQKNKDIIHFNESHMTVPIIFMNGTFIGGFHELQIKLKHNS